MGLEFDEKGFSRYRVSEKADKILDNVDKNLKINRTEESLNQTLILDLTTALSSDHIEITFQGIEAGGRKFGLKMYRKYEALYNNEDSRKTAYSQCMGEISFAKKQGRSR